MPARHALAAWRKNNSSDNLACLRWPLEVPPVQWTGPQRCMNVQAAGVSIGRAAALRHSHALLGHATTSLHAPSPVTKTLYSNSWARPMLCLGAHSLLRQVLTSLLPAAGRFCLFPKPSPWFPYLTRMHSDSCLFPQSSESPNTQVKPSRACHNGAPTQATEVRPQTRAAMAANQRSALKPLNTFTTRPQTMYPGTTLHSMGTTAAPSHAEAAAAATSPGASQPGNIWRPV